jgi:hypothetical protein
VHFDLDAKRDDSPTVLSGSWAVVLSGPGEFVRAMGLIPAGAPA